MAPTSGKAKPSKAPVDSDSDSDCTPLSEVANKAAVPSPPVEAPSAKKRRRSSSAKFSQESSEDLSESNLSEDDGADGLEHEAEVVDSEDDYTNLTMDDEEFEATKELR